MKVAAVVSDLMLYSRIESAARVAGIEVARVDDPHHIPSDAELVLVDWSERGADWAEALQPTVGRRVIVFGPHTDLEAHTDARAAGLGPMWARSKLLADLPELLAPPDDRM
jgi:hypothetical protein